MSKEPQVGDVWKLKDGRNVYIYGCDEETVDSIKFTGGFLWSGHFRKKEFLENHDYLGKSKANIDDLFKTENEE